MLRQMELLKDLMEPLRGTLARKLLRCGERRALGVRSVYREARAAAPSVVARGKVEHLDSDGARCGEAGPSELVEGAMVAAHVRRAASARALGAASCSRRRWRRCAAASLCAPAAAPPRHLGATPFFRNLAWKVRWGVAALLEFVELRKGDRIFRKGDAGDALYVVVAGRVAISRRQQKALGAAGSAERRRHRNPRHRRRRRGASVVWRARLWLKEPRAADAAAAETPTTLLVLERSSFRGLPPPRPRFRDACRTAAESIKTINELSKRARLDTCRERAERRSVREVWLVGRHGSRGEALQGRRAPIFRAPRSRSRWTRSRRALAACAGPGVSGGGPLGWLSVVVCTVHKTPPRPSQLLRRPATSSYLRELWSRVVGQPVTVLAARAILTMLEQLDRIRGYATELLYRRLSIAGGEHLGALAPNSAVTLVGASYLTGEADAEEVLARARARAVGRALVHVPPRLRGDRRHELHERRRLGLHDADGPDAARGRSRRTTLAARGAAVALDVVALADAAAAAPAAAPAPADGGGGRAAAPAPAPAADDGDGGGEAAARGRGRRRLHCSRSSPTAPMRRLGSTRSSSRAPRRARRPGGGSGPPRSPRC